MRREDFDHVIAAAANIVDLDEFVVVGSQAILGSHPDAPARLVESMEVELYPRAAPDRAIEVEGTLGDGSQFHRTFGYFAHGVGPATAVAPAGWEDRLVRVVVPGRVGSARSPIAYCLDPQDLVLAKCVRGDERDWSHAKAALDARLVTRETLLARVDDLPIENERRAVIRERLRIL